MVVKKHENKDRLNRHDLKDPKSFTKLVVGMVMFFTLVKPNDGSMIGSRTEHFKR